MFTATLCRYHIYVCKFFLRFCIYDDSLCIVSCQNEKFLIRWAYKWEGIILPRSFQNNYNNMATVLGTHPATTSWLGKIHTGVFWTWVSRSNIIIVNMKYVIFSTKRRVGHLYSTFIISDVPLTGTRINEIRLT